MDHWSPECSIAFSKILNEPENKWEGFNMDPQQEEHLDYLKEQWAWLAGPKYRKGAKEHGGKLEESYTIDQLLDMSIEENIDQFVYLITLRDKIRGNTEKQKFKNWDKE